MESSETWASVNAGELAAAVRERSTAAILVANLRVPALAARTLFDASDPDGLVHLIAEENRTLARELREISDAHVFDLDGLVAEAGSGAFCDPKLWYMARVMGGPASQLALARNLVRAAGAHDRGLG